MAKPGVWDLEINFVPDCQAVRGAAVAGTIHPICSLTMFHTVRKGQKGFPWAEIPHTPLPRVHIAQAVLRCLMSGRAGKGGLEK